MSRDDLENLLRSHLASELDSQRGNAVDAFQNAVMAPMQKQLAKPSTRLHPVRFWSAIGTAMAACVAIGFALPQWTHRTETASTITPEISARSAVQPANFEHTSILRSHDSGMVMVNTDTPARRIRQSRVDQYRWTDPQTGGKYEILEPSSDDLVLQVHRQ